jgi:ribosome-binding protein aMBF1 (putative translation factor)
MTLTPKAVRASIPKASAVRAAGARRHGPSSALEEAEFLRKVGQQVRDARARHGMTRRMLAHDSGLSERYLALLEDGRGNLSMVLLRHVAAAPLVLEDRPL